MSDPVLPAIATDVYQDAANVANSLIELEASHPAAASVLKDFARLFVEKIKAGEPFADCAIKSAELAVSEALLRSRL
jgi:hypothetical protein